MNDLKAPGEHSPPLEQPPQGFGESPSLEVFRVISYLSAL